MFKELLEKISHINIPLNGKIEEDGDQLINTIIFGKDFCGDPSVYKKKFFRMLRFKERAIIEIEEEIYSSELSHDERKILLQETEFRLLKIDFLRDVYNTEAQKINPKIQLHYKYSIEIYNNAFYGVTKKDLAHKYTLDICKSYPSVYSKDTLLKLIAYSKTLCPEMEFKFGNYTNFSHRAGKLFIPNHKYYNIQNIISLFFHESTHFFRTFNGSRNLGFEFQFAGYSTLEEGAAIYNEYLYGNKIFDYGSYIPYYNICLNYLLQDIGEEEKKKKICEVLACKGYSKEKSLGYYNRFYRYCPLGSTRLFLKDLIYYNGYKNVKKLVKKDSKNYEKIMAGDIGIVELGQEIVKPINNFDHKMYFSKMVKEIKKIIV